MRPIDQRMRQEERTITQEALALALICAGIVAWVIALRLWVPDTWWLPW